MKKLNPIWKRVIVKVENKSNQTSFWIVLPENNSKERPQMWKIIEIWKNIEEDIKIWDTIVFREFSPTDIEIEWETFLILESQDILAKIS
jgi:chaperonin GroES